MELLKTFEHGNAMLGCDGFSYEKKPEIRDFIESPELSRIIETV